MAIELTAWEGYRVVWFRVEAAAQQADSDLTWAQALRAYCRLSGLKMAQVHLQSEDNQTNRFIQDIEAAIDQAAGQAASPEIRSIPREDSFAWIELINRINETGRPLLLALDRYDQIESQAVHEMMADLLEYLPDGLQIALFSRGTPPLPFARLRARRLLLEVAG